ncbi:hypothetical protein [Sulfurimonas sp.]|uniref:hypothetical protein n=1 Tax=Sulfurimonas sp. TaxID=2022749 RepID=UPI003C765372
MLFNLILLYLDSSHDVASTVMTLALEKLYNDYGLEQGDEVVITKKKSLEKVSKMKLSFILI